MSSPVVQVQARLGSTRLPGKVLYSLGRRRVVERVRERAASAETTGGVVFTIGDRPENDALREWCERNGLSHITAPEDDLLERHLRAAEATDTNPVVRVTGDCPFVPPSEIDRLVREHEDNSARYTTNVTEGMPVGVGADVIDRDVLEELRDLGDDHPVRRLREAPEQWDVAFSPDERWTQFADAHVAVDTPEDYWTLTDALSAVGDDPFEVVRWVAQR